MPPLSPAPQIPALPAKLRSNPLPNLLSNQRLVNVASLRNPSLLISPNFFLTIPITSYTITSPASLRSDHLIGINRNADRHHARTLIDFPGIRNSSNVPFSGPSSSKSTLGTTSGLRNLVQLLPLYRK